MDLVCVLVGSAFIKYSGLEMMSEYFDWPCLLRVVPSLGGVCIQYKFKIKFTIFCLPKGKYWSGEF